MSEPKPEAAPRGGGTARPDQDRERAGRPGTLGALDPFAAAERRTARIREEIARNRRGEYTVPTWVLAAALAAVVALWVLVLFVL